MHKRLSVFCNVGMVEILEDADLVVRFQPTLFIQIADVDAFHEVDLGSGFFLDLHRLSETAAADFLDHDVFVHRICLLDTEIRFESHQIKTR